MIDRHLECDVSEVHSPSSWHYLNVEGADSVLGAFALFGDFPLNLGEQAQPIQGSAVTPLTRVCE